MAYHYKVKPFPILIIVLVLTLLITFCVFIIKKNDKNKSVNDSSTSSVINSNSSVVSKPITDDSPSANSSTPIFSSNPSSQTSGKPVIDKNAWNLILLNKTHALSKELNIKKVKFDVEWVDERAGIFYAQMRDAAKKDGINLFLRSGYRTIKLQKTYYDSNYNAYIKSGKSPDVATALTEQYYARPGESEHHSGLAMDIISVEYQQQIHTLDERFANTDAYNWLSKHAVEYGFILRYPKEKVDVTKINYEPWHYRYVGLEHAKYIKEHNLCLEEYLQ